MQRRRPLPLYAKIAATIALIVLVETVIDHAASLLTAAALGWIAMLVLTRPTVRRSRGACAALVMALLFVATLIDDPSPLAVLLFLIAITLAALLPRRRFDDAIAWGLRLGWLGATAVVLPLRDLGRARRARERGRGEGFGLAAIVTTLELPVLGGVLFIALFASANPLIDRAFSDIALPGIGTIVWRSLIGIAVLLPVWATLRPNPRVTAWNGDLGGIPLAHTGPAALIVSLVTFNAIFAVQNALDIVFLWSGTALPAGVTMADYAHRGAYALIATASLAGLFVLVTLRPGSPGATRPAVRRLVTAWIVQNLLLVASSALRTLDYVDAYSMTVLRLAALLWMALVAMGLMLILWRLLRDRSAAWLINANAFAAAVVLTLCAIVDLGATAAAWNVRVAIARGVEQPRLDTCYLESLGASALVPLARLERQTRDPILHDRIAALRWQAQSNAADRQTRWSAWTWRNARRLRTVETLVGPDAPHLRPALLGRACGVIEPPPPAPAPPPAQRPIATPSQLTDGAQR